MSIVRSEEKEELVGRKVVPPNLRSKKQPQNPEAYDFYTGAKEQHTGGHLGSLV